MRKATAAALTGLLFLTAGAPAFAADGDRTDIDDITILATTDTHGTALNYNYFTGKPFGTPEEPKNLRGMDHLATAIADIRKDKGESAVALLDNGDANQGSSLETVYKRDHKPGDVDPIATIYNYLEYDAGVVGNHEFNYGLDELQDYKGALDFPLLGANVTDKKTGKPYLEPYTFINKTTADGHDVKIAVIGVVTPGIPGWDGKKVESLNFGDQVEAVQKYVPEVKEKGADVVVVLAHTGLDPEGYEWKAADLQENAARSIAENTTGVDVVIGGHSHQTDQVQNYYTNKDGHEVLFTQPGYHGRFLSNITIPLSLDNDKVVVDWNEKEKPSAVAVKAADYAADPEIEKLISDWHEKTKKWVATVVAKATEDMPAATSAWEDTAILDFINYVQTEEIKRAMKGTKNEGLPIVAEASPFSREAVFKKGDVTIADMASLYIYDNTLLGVKMNGTQLKEYLEHSARYYKQQEEGAKIDDWSTVTNAQYDGMTRGIPDYSYDVLSGVSYHINISKPVGKRIENLTWPDGTPVKDNDEFILALNNYRQSGGSGYPAVKEAEVVYDEQMAIRDLMIDWATKNSTIDPANFFAKNWDVSTSAAPAVDLPADDEVGKPSGDSGTPVDEPKDEAPADGDADGEADDSADASDDGKTIPISDSDDDADHSRPTAPSRARGPLPRTGAESLAVAGVAFSLLAAGGAMIARRRRA